MGTSAQRYDVLGLGCVAVDDIFHVPTYPAADAKVRVTRHERRFGGLTGNALVAAARLGARCAYGGCLGLDDASQFIEQEFLREGVDVTPAPRSEGAAVIRSAIFRAIVAAWSTTLSPQTRVSITMLLRATSAR